MSELKDLIDLFNNRRAVVGVIGLGYVGLPLAATIAEAGFAAVGFDTKTSKIEALHRRESYIRHVPAARLEKLVRTDAPVAGRAGLLRRARTLPIWRSVTESSSAFRRRSPRTANPTSRTSSRPRKRSPSICGVANSSCSRARPIPARRMRSCDRCSSAAACASGATSTSPSRPSGKIPNNSKFTTRTIPKLVGGVTPACGRVAAALYGTVIERVMPVSSASVAEAAKLLENIYRSVNIALVNELKVLFERMGLNVWEVIDAAATKPFGFTPFYPGPGLGGHCIPIDPFYLTWRARQFELTTRFIELAGEVNLSMPAYVVDRLGDALNERGRSLKGCEHSLLGVAYKRDLDDDRESPAYKLMELLERKQREVQLPRPVRAGAAAFAALRLRLESVPLTAETPRRSRCRADRHGPLGVRLRPHRAPQPPGRGYSQRHAQGQRRTRTDRPRLTRRPGAGARPSRPNLPVLHLTPDSKVL